MFDVIFQEHADLQSIKVAKRLLDSGRISLSDEEIENLIKNIERTLNNEPKYLSFNFKDEIIKLLETYFMNWRTNTHYHYSEDSREQIVSALSLLTSSKSNEFTRLPNELQDLVFEYLANI